MPQYNSSSSRKIRTRWEQFLEDSSIIRFYVKRYKKLVIVGLLALAIVDLLELLPPILLKDAVDVLVENRPRQLLLYLAGAYLANATIQGVCRYAWRMYLIRSSMLSGRDLRFRFTDHLFGLSSSFFDKNRVGDLMSLATNDVDAVRMAIGAGLLTFADALFYIATVPIAMIYLSPTMALLAFAPMPLIPWFVMKNEKEIHRRFQAVQGQFSKLAAMAQENLNGVRVVKSFAREDVQLRRFRELGEKYIALNMSLSQVQSAFGPTLDLVMSLGMVLLLWVGGFSLMDGAISLGTFVAFQRYIQKMVWPMTAIGLSITHYQRAIASSERMKEILRTRPSIEESSNPQLPEDYSKQLGIAWRTQGRIEVKNLNFQFGEQKVLKDLTFNIEPGERIAIVGSIGSGKTTFLSLLPRLYPIADGMIRIDGIDINHWPLEELRRQIGYVGQELFLFSDTVFENVALGLHGMASSEQKYHTVMEAMKLSAMQDEVKAFTNSYETRLGERGVNVSGGQKQRLTLARALAKQPSILVLDDALSSVDVKTEEQILSSLRSRPGRNTEIIAAHRISTVQEANKIIVLSDGCIEAMGTHHQLISTRSGTYYRFHEQQRMQEDLERFIEKYEEAPAQEERVLV